jgi:hypothetical protein
LTVRRSLALVLAALSVGGCIDYGDKDAKVPGDDLGHFDVSATLSSSDCGPDALGSEQLWEFDVRLSRDGADLFWLNGAEVIAGSLAADGLSFSFDTLLEFEIQPPDPPHAGCTVLRQDRADGTLSSPDLAVESFTASLTYRYAPGEGSDCSRLVDVPGGFSTLPCEITYLLDGRRKQTAAAAR